MDTRKQFFKSLIVKALKDKNIYLLVGDLGYSFCEEFQKTFPDRFINCGIAEQNMIGIATGLTIMNKKVYCYSNAVFLNYRCLEQIRDAWLQGLDINIIGTRTSGFLGFTHNFFKGEIEPLKRLSKQLNKVYLKI